MKGQCVLCMQTLEVNNLGLCEECFAYMDKVCSH